MNGSPIAFQFDSFRCWPVRQAMSGRVVDGAAGGDVGYARDNDHSAIDVSRQAFLAAAEFDPAALTLGQQTHGAGVHVVTDTERGRGQPPDFAGLPATDGLVTLAPSVALGAIVADCVPLLFYDPRQHALAVVHAGWRGTVAGIATVAARTMQTQFGTRLDELRVGIGPSIGPCCYEVGAEVIEAWRATAVSNAERAVSHGTSYHFDLWSANRLTLEGIGIARRNIEVSGRCTRCERQRFFSYRAARQGLAPAGRMLLVAQLLPR
jgi:purine-nucleoside/S-methyl-5'-thioadenosine phosphorylase / adenosine deaminase